MKKMIRIALALALVLSLLVSAALAETVISDTFNILDEITIKVEQPVEEGPAEEIPVEEQPAEEQPLPERSLSIELSKPLSEVAFGDEVMLTAILEGYEGAEVEIVWERLEGDAWMPTGDTSRSIVITIDEQTAQSAWRFTANVLKEAQPAAEESAQ